MFDVEREFLERSTATLYFEWKILALKLKKDVVSLRMCPTNKLPSLFSTWIKNLSLGSYEAPIHAGYFHTLLNLSKINSLDSLLESPPEGNYVIIRNIN